jgi:hypothetical protein
VPDADATRDGCNLSGAGCDDTTLRPDRSPGDVARSDSGDVRDVASDQGDERRPSDVATDSADQRSPTDVPIADVSDDAETDDSDVVADAVSTADVSDGEGGPGDASDAESGTPGRDSPAVDVNDVAQLPTFYRAINVGASDATALTIDGQSWEAGLTAANVTYSGGTDAAGSGGFARVTNIPLIPATDANRTNMIQSFAWGRPIAFSMSNVPTARYLVYMYTWEDNGAQTFDVLLQGQVVLANYNSGANGHWERLGPWAVDISAGSIAITTRPTTGAAFANLCGVEIWRQ